MTKPLKLYFVQRNGDRERIVAAASKASALRLLGVSVHEFKRFGGETHAKHTLSLVLATPGVVWERSKRSSLCGKDDWEPIGGPETHKSIVLARFPDAVAENDYGRWCVNDDSLYDDLGTGDSEEEAWSCAFRRTSIQSPAGVTPNAITVWRFEDAPAGLQELSCEGEEEWLAWVPDQVKRDRDRWLSELGCRVNFYPIRGGMIVIGAH